MSRPMWVPWIGEAAAVWHGVSESSFWCEATAMANALADAFVLTGADGIILPLDHALIPEALGSTVLHEHGALRPLEAPWAEGAACDALADLQRAGRIPMFLDVVHRLALTIARDHLVVVTLPGPGLLARTLTGEGPGSDDPSAIVASARLIQGLARAVAEAGTKDLMLVDTEPSPPIAGTLAAMRSAYRTLHNILRFYRTRFWLREADEHTEQLAGATRNGEVVIAPLLTDVVVDVVTHRGEAPFLAGGSTIAHAIPLRVLRGGESAAWVRSRLRAGSSSSAESVPVTIFTTSEMLVGDFPIEHVRSVLEVLGPSRS